jgi:heme A synthase
MSDIGTPSDPPPIEPTSAQWWRERSTDLGFWGTVVIVFLVAVVVFGQIAGSSGATGTLVATLLLIGVIALVALVVLAIARHRLTRDDDEDERGGTERAG